MMMVVMMMAVVYNHHNLRRRRIGHCEAEEKCHSKQNLFHTSVSRVPNQITELFRPHRKNGAGYPIPESFSDSRA